MRYFLNEAESDDLSAMYEIKKVEFETYKNANEVLSTCLSIEINYDILISNYIELEEQIFKETASYLICGYSGYSTSLNILRTLNRSLVNLLASARMYTDQLANHVSRCIPSSSNTKCFVKSLKSNEYDSNWDYRFMEALRNHVQHRSLPVHWFNLSNSSDEVDGVRMVEVSLEFALETSRLDKSFKQDVLVDAPEKVSLKSTTRNYIESLRKIHVEIRKHISESVGNSRLLIEDSHRNYSRFRKKDVKFVEARKVDNKKLLARIPLMLEWDDQRIELQKRNNTYKRLDKGYISTKPTSVASR